MNYPSDIAAAIRRLQPGVVSCSAIALALTELIQRTNKVEDDGRLDDALALADKAYDAIEAALAPTDEEREQAAQDEADDWRRQDDAREAA